MRVSRVVFRILAIGVTVWTVALFLAPDLLFPIGSFICHQRPERSFVFDGRQLPVCARCTGLYVGAAVAAPLAVIAASAATARRARWIFVLTALPTLITWTAEYAGLAHFSNSLRAIAALPLGFTAAWLVLGELRATRAART